MWYLKQISKYHTKTMFQYKNSTTKAFYCNKESSRSAEFFFYLLCGNLIIKSNIDAVTNSLIFGVLV